MYTDTQSDIKQKKNPNSPSYKQFQDQVIGQHNLLTNYSGALSLNLIDNFIISCLERALKSGHDTSYFRKSWDPNFLRKNVKIAHGWYAEKAKLIDIMRQEKFRDPNEGYKLTPLPFIGDAKKLDSKPRNSDTAMKPTDIRG